MNGLSKSISSVFKDTLDWRRGEDIYHEHLNILKEMRGMPGRGQEMTFTKKGRGSGC